MGMGLKRGQIIIANLNPVVGSEQGKVRPNLIIQNDLGNKISPTTIIAPITSKNFNRNYPFSVKLYKEESGLSKDSVIQLNQIRVIDKSRITKIVKALDPYTMKKVDDAIKISLGLE